jgi:hypothetical protein
MSSNRHELDQRPAGERNPGRKRHSPLPEEESERQQEAEGGIDMAVPGDLPDGQGCQA